MNLTLERFDFTTERTIGRLSIDGHEAAYTLEDAVHGGPKIPGETAIPAGRYAVKVTKSQRFGRMLPELLRRAELCRDSYSRGERGDRHARLHPRRARAGDEYDSVVTTSPLFYSADPRGGTSTRRSDLDRHHADRKRELMTITLLLVLAAFVSTVASAMGKCPLWVAVLLLVLVELLRILPR